MGGYELKKTNSNPEITIIASGSEVQIAIDALNKLQAVNINSKVVSMPAKNYLINKQKITKKKLLKKTL